MGRVGIQFLKHSQQRFAVLVLLSLLLAHCKPAPNGMAELNDPLSISGCYKSTAFKADLITIDPNEIRLNEEVIYSRYEYGTTRGGQSPYLYANPRGYLWNDDGKLSFSIHDPSGSATLMPELIEGRKVFRLPAFPTADVSDFGADIRLVAFTKSFCLSDTTPNSL